VESDCKGLFGRLFGHCFVSLVIESIPPTTQGLKLKGVGDFVANMVGKLTTKKFVVCCKRCGIEPEAILSKKGNKNIINSEKEEKEEDDSSNWPCVRSESNSGESQ
jgi:hypothetical protein